MAPSDPKYRIESLDAVDGQLCIDWSDGHSSRFHPIWLRHQCACPACGSPLTAVRGLRLHHIPSDIAFRVVAHDGGTVDLVWTNDGHPSRYSATWLRDHCYSYGERQRRRHRPILWDRRIHNDPPTADMPACEASAAQRLALLERVRDYGFCRVGNAGTEAAETERLINLVGPQRRSHYGTYKLSKKAAVDNVGDITDPLDPHVDETYRLSTIGITVFQVLRPSAEGGHSTLVDGFEAVRRLKAAHRADFELLTRVPITGSRRDQAHNSAGQVKWYAATMPAIRLDFDGEVSGLRCNERQIMPLDLPERLIEPCYRALKHLFEILYDPDLRVTFELAAGEGLIFDNQRVLHGRTGFSAEEPARSVLTSSVDMEEFHSSLRLLTEQLRGHVPPLRLAQGMVA
ncbi:MAG: TauD/TfdA family dioxygenase [Pseudomonadota bacterium]